MRRPGDELSCVWKVLSSGDLAGTAFALELDDGPVFISAWHCVSRSNVTLIHDEGHVITLSDCPIVFQDHELDIAILRPPSATRFRALRLSHVGKLRPAVGSNIEAFGYKAIGERDQRVVSILSRIPGTVSASQGDRLWIAGPLGAGMSGGPLLFANDGALGVVGMVVAMATEIPLLDGRRVPVFGSFLALSGDVLWRVLSAAQLQVATLDQSQTGDPHEELVLLLRSLPHCRVRELRDDAGRVIHFLVDGQHFEARVDVQTTVVRALDASAYVTRFRNDSFVLGRLSHWLGEVVAAATEPTVATWISPRVSKEGSDSADRWNEFVGECAREGEPRLRLLCGPQGSGKSATLRWIWKQMLSNGLSVPVFFLDLRDLSYLPTGSLAEAVASTLADSRRCGLTKEQYRDAIRGGDAVLLLDSLDELLERPDRGSLSGAVFELSRLATRCRAVVVSSREGLFASRPLGSVFNTTNVYRLEAWSDDEIAALADKMSAGGGARVVAELLAHGRTLLRTPLGLRLLLEVQGTATRYSLYDEYTERQFATNAVRRLGARIGPDRMRLILEDLALAVLDANTWEVTEDECRTIVDRLVDRDAQEVYAAVYLMPFIVRTPTGLRFEHLSFLEFLVASRYARELEAASLNRFGVSYYRREVFQFLADWICVERLDLVERVYLASAGQRRRIHLLMALDLTGHPRAHLFVEQRVLNEPSLRVAGHAAELSFKRTGDICYLEQVFARFEAARGSHIEGHREAHSGWHVDSSRDFDVPAGHSIVRRALAMLRADLEHELSSDRAWYCASFLARVSNLPQHSVRPSDLADLADLAPESRIVAYLLQALARTGATGASVRRSVERYLAHRDLGVRLAANDCLRAIAP